jgi:hypothetical protein
MEDEDARKRTKDKLIRVGLFSAWNNTLLHTKVTNPLE